MYNELPFDCILGTDFFQAKKATIDWDTGTIRLRHPNVQVKIDEVLHQEEEATKTTLLLVRTERVNSGEWTKVLVKSENGKPLKPENGIIGLGGNNRVKTHEGITSAYNDHTYV